LKYHVAALRSKYAQLRSRQLDVTTPEVHRAAVPSVKLALADSRIVVAEALAAA